MQNAATAQVFVWMLLEAQWKDDRQFGIDLKPGELATTMPQIQFALNLTEKQVRMAIEALRELEVIVTRAHDGKGLGRGKRTVFRFVNWDKYQSSDSEQRENKAQEGAGWEEPGARVEAESLGAQADPSPKKGRSKTKELSKNNSADAAANAEPSFNFFGHLIKVLTDEGVVITERGGVAVGRCNQKGKKVGEDVFKQALNLYIHDRFTRQNGLSINGFINAFDRWATLAAGEIETERKRYVPPLPDDF
jgi:hypothetical protein